MVLIQLDLPEELDKKVRLFMAKNDIKEKKKAVIEIIEKGVKG